MQEISNQWVPGKEVISYYVNKVIKKKRDYFISVCNKLNIFSEHKRLAFAYKQKPDLHCIRW